MKPEALTRWTAEDAAQLYSLREWSAGYFDVSPDGKLLVKPSGPGAKTSVALPEIVSQLKARGLNFPILLRFGDILASRVESLNTSFRAAMEEAGYQGDYRAVYPIKVNQQQHVVEEVMKEGRPFHHGLEVGSKAELIAALAHLDDPDALLVCNGYKDEEFIDLALYALKMGLQVILVVEMPGELGPILQRAERMSVTPRLGVRAKLAARAGGHWTDSGGDRSTFGLTASQIIDLVDRLREGGRLHCLEMLHYHLGSQIPNIRSIRSAVVEACRFYVDLAREGAGMRFLNVGGGLAVDYDGSHTNFPSSCNYGVGEYAADIVEAALDSADAAGIPHPTIVTESGRATVAHHAVLIFDILDVTRFESHGHPGDLPPDAHEMIQNLVYVNEHLTLKNAQECYHDAVYYRDQVRSLFNVGTLSLRDRALAERIFWCIVDRIAQQTGGRKYIPEEITDLKDALADVYHGNFSVFQSLPDAWAIEQLFPVVPLDRLNEAPTRQGTISDITCDCDGRISRFIDLHDVNKTLPLHELRPGEDYVLGVFLVGAYQETLGDLHNLLGDTNVVGVRVGEDGSVEYSSEISGDTVADVLSYVEYRTDEMIERFRKSVRNAVAAGSVSSQEAENVLKAYEDGLSGYTYFES